jgi:cysteine desulfurase
MIYADYNATTPLDPRVIDVMVRSMEEDFGNPSSTQHGVGYRAANNVANARRQVSEAIGVRQSELIFTSGATEAINAAIFGVVARNSLQRNPKTRIMVSPTEHKAVLESVQTWSTHFNLEVVSCVIDRRGLIDVDHFRETLSKEFLLVAIALANNETGVINDVEKLAKIAQQHDAVFFSDATQALGKVNLDISGMGLDLVAVSAHKAYGPKGIGALAGTKKILDFFPALQSGGGQERGIRGGTLNVPGIVGFGEACSIAVREMDTDARRIDEIGSVFFETICRSIDGVTRNGRGASLLPNTFNFRIPEADGEALLSALSGIAISTGSACQSAVPSPSHVLLAMGLTHEEARESLRVSFGKFSRMEEVEPLVEAIADAADWVRSMS